MDASADIQDRAGPSANRGEHARAEPPVRPLLLTITDAARALSVGRTTMYELIAAGAIEVVHIGRSARVPVAALEAFVQQQRRGTLSVSSSASSPAALGPRTAPRRRVPQRGDQERLFGGTRPQA
jgi:excisionase family DNA binding protein